MCDVGDVAETAANVGTFGTYGAAKNTIDGKNIFADGPFGVFDKIGGWGGSGGDDIPGMEGDYLRQHRQAYDDWAAQYTDPTRYQAMTDEYSQQASNQAMTRFNAIGMAGSGAAIGGSNEASRKMKMGMLDRQLRDRSQIESTRLGYTSQLQNVDIAHLNAKMAKQNADSQMIGGIMGAAGMAAGAYFGGPMGAAAGGKVGSSMAPEQGSMSPYNAYAGGGPTLGNYGGYDTMGGTGYGQPGNFWSQNPYAY